MWSDGSYSYVFLLDQQFKDFIPASMSQLQKHLRDISLLYRSKRPGKTITSLPAAYMLFCRRHVDSDTYEYALFGHPSGRPFLSPIDFVEHYDNLTQSKDANSMNCQCILCRKKTSILLDLSETLASTIEKTFPEQIFPKSDLKIALNQCLSNFVSQENVSRDSEKIEQKEIREKSPLVPVSIQETESIDNPSPIDNPKEATQKMSTLHDKKRPPEKIPYSSDFREDDLVWIPIICDLTESREFLHLSEERRLPIRKISTQTILWPAIIEKVFQSSEHISQLPFSPLLLSSVGKKVLLKSAYCVNNYVLPANTYAYQIRLISLEKVLPFNLPEECIIPHVEASLPKIWLSIKANDIALLRQATSDVLLQCYFEAIVRMSHRTSFFQIHRFPKDVGFTLGCETFRIGDLIRVRVQLKGKESSQAILRLASFQSLANGHVKCYGRHVLLNSENRPEDATVFIPFESMKIAFPGNAVMIRPNGDRLVPCSLREVNATFYEFLDDRILGRFYRHYPNLTFDDTIGFRRIIK